MTELRPHQNANYGPAAIGAQTKMESEAAGVTDAGVVTQPVSNEQSLRHGLDPGFVEDPVSLQFPVPRKDPTVSIYVTFSRVFPAALLWNDSHSGQELFP